MDKQTWEEWIMNIWFYHSEKDRKASAAGNVMHEDTFKNAMNELYKTLYEANGAKGVKRTWLVCYFQ